MLGVVPPLLLLDAAADDVELLEADELLEDDEPQPAINAAATHAGTSARFQTAMEILPSV